MKLVTSAQMRTLEERSVEAGVGLDQLMDSAGLNVAQEVWMQLGHLEDRRIVVLVGPGNNGGDGLVAARHLAEWGSAVRCYALRARDDEQWQRTLDANVPCGTVADDDNFEALDALLGGAEVIIDALLGTGLSSAEKERPIEGDLAEILTRLGTARQRTIKPKLIAVDVPTGLDADSGRADPLTVAPDETVTFQYPKVGLYTQPGAALAGDVQTVEIGIPAGLDTDMRIELVERRDAKKLLPERRADAHKGSFGKVLVIAGSPSYPGAAILAASAAYKSGAGLVALATGRSLIPALVSAMPEVIYHPLPDDDGALGEAAAQALREVLPSYDVVVIGCGLGTAAPTQSFVRSVLRDDGLDGRRAVVVDADALNALNSEPGGSGDFWTQVKAPLVLTPHPGEMARLIDADSETVQARRLELALARAAEWGSQIVLKGANTIVADPDGRASVSAIANAALATAGSGDVLAGVIGGLLAQGCGVFEASTLGVYLHGNAGERAAKAVGSAGTTARDILQHVALAGRALSGEEPLGGDGGGGLGMGLGQGGGMGSGMGDISQLMGGDPSGDPGAGMGGPGFGDPGLGGPGLGGPGLGGPGPGGPGLPSQ